MVDRFRRTASGIRVATNSRTVCWLTINRVCLSGQASMMLPLDTMPSLEF